MKTYRSFSHFEEVQVYICRFGGTLIGRQMIGDRLQYVVLQEGFCGHSI
jgi:hypothetical protein